MDDDALDEAEDAQAIIELVVAKAEQAAEAALAAQEAALREELLTLRPRALQRRAEQMGVAEDDLDEAEDTESIIELIITSPEGPRAGGRRERPVGGREL